LDVTVFTLLLGASSIVDVLSKFVEKLVVKGIKKFIASELPLEKVKKKYGNHFSVVMGDLNQTDDLRVLDYNGYNVFYNFSFSDMSKPVYHEL
jgi:hypothetical protein